MAKSRTSYLCRNCGGIQARWMGKCPDCGTWDALEKVVSEPAVASGADSTLTTAIWTPWSATADALPVDEDDERSSSGMEPAVDDASFGSDDDESWMASAVEHRARPETSSTPTARPLARVSLDDVHRLPTGVGELDRVLGGGLVPGSVVLIGGDPGIGKSTLLLQAVAGLAGGEREHRILYVSSEESARQVRLRAERLFESAESGQTRDGAIPTASPSASVLVSERLFVLSETNLARIVEQTRRVRPAVLVVDSLQMVFRPGVEAGPGSVTQLRRCCIELVNLAKRTGTVVLIVGHVTKDGQLAGPRLVEHLVDVVLGFEGDRHHAYRLVRAAKNRFGDTLEIGLFEMTGSGLRQVLDPGSVFDPAIAPGPGSVICPTMHGTRCLLAEVQALTATGVLGAARRKASGIDPSRLAMLVAVLEKHGGLRLADQDIFVAVAGGLRVVEPAADLAIALAIAGAHFGRSLPSGVAVVGELALSGQIRPVSQMAQRVREANRRGSTTVLVPRTEAEEMPAGPTIVTVNRLFEAIEMLC